MVAAVTAYNESLTAGGRDEGEQSKREGARRLKVSVEVEKTRPELSQLLPLADVVSWSIPLVWTSLVVCEGMDRVKSVATGRYGALTFW